MNEKFQKVAKKFRIDKTIQEPIESIAEFGCNATITIFRPSDKQYTDLLGMVREITIYTACMYEIQIISMSYSMGIIEKNFSTLDKEHKDIIVKYNKLSSLFNQFITEMNRNDFASTVLEENISGQIAKSWNWEKLMNSSQETVNQLTRQIEKMSMEKTRKSEIKIQKILFAFTLLTIVEVVSAFLQIYDIENSISPILRLISLLVVFGVALSVILSYIREK